jgi:hypothetical protein
MLEGELCTSYYGKILKSLGAVSKLGVSHVKELLLWGYT